MRVACAALPSTLVPDVGSLCKLVRVGGSKAAEEETEKREAREREREEAEVGNREATLPSTTEDTKEEEGDENENENENEKQQLWSLGSGGVLVWTKGGEDSEESIWTPMAILDGAHSPIFAIGIPSGAETSGLVITGSGDGLLCFWDKTLLQCVGRARLPLRYGCIRGAVYDRVSGLVAVLTRRQSPNTDFVLLVNPATRRLKTVLCNSSLYSVLDIHETGGKSGCMVSYELGEDAKLLGTLDMLQKFEPAKSEHVHTPSEAAQLRSLVSSLVNGMNNGAEIGFSSASSSSHNMILSHDHSVLFYIHGGKRKLLTFERKNKTERDVLYDKAILLDHDQDGDTGFSHDHHFCQGAAMWGSSAASEGVLYLLSWFKDSKACLQCIRKGGRTGAASSKVLAADYTVMRQVELDWDILQGGENRTQWTVLGNFQLARSLQKDENLCLEVVDLADQLDGRNQKDEPLNRKFHYFRDPTRDNELKGNQVTEELMLKDCLGHTFVHVLGHSSGTLSLLPWPLVEAEEDSVERQFFPGHESAISCIAEWNMVNDKKVACRIMLSGCQGGQVKVWNLENLNCISSMDVCQAGVSAFVMPERNSNYIWSDCFLVVGKDGSISCVSTKEMKKVRAFLAYPAAHELVSVAWNYKRNCAACLSVNHGSDGVPRDFLCSIIEITSCHLDRQASGSNALVSFFDFMSMDKQYLAICDVRGNKKNASLNYATLEKSLRMVVISSDLDLLLEASGKQPDLQVVLCMVMLSMHVHHIDEKINFAFENQINRALATINQNDLHRCTHMPRSSLHLLPTLVGPDNSYTVWLSSAFHSARKRLLPAQLLARMNLVVLSALGWAHEKSLISPEHFSSLNTFYGIRVPEAIKGASMEAMASYVDYLEHTSEHMRDAANVLLNSMIANMEEDAKLSAVRDIKTVIKGSEYGSRSWAKKVLILGSIALSIQTKYDHSFVVNALTNSVGEPGLPFHSSLVSLLTRGIGSSTGEWKGIIDKCYLKLLSSVTDAIHAVNGQVPQDLSPRKADKMKPFSTLLCRDKLMHLLALLMQKNVHQFMNIFNEKLCTGELGPGSSVLPMVFTSILSLINTHPWSLFGATHQVLSACFTCMHPSNPNMRRSYLHIGMTVICEMGQKLPFIDMNASSMWICIPTPPVENNASRYIHIFNAKSGDLVHELQFENQRHLTPLAVKISPDSNLLACYSIEDTCIRIWAIKQSWTSTFRLSPKVNLPGQCIECRTKAVEVANEANGSSMSHLQGYMLKWIAEKEILLLHDNVQIGKYSVTL